MHIRCSIKRLNEPNNSAPPVVQPMIINHTEGIPIINYLKPLITSQPKESSTSHHLHLLKWFSSVWSIAARLGIIKLVRFSQSGFN